MFKLCARCIDLISISRDLPTLDNEVVISTSLSDYVESQGVVLNKDDKLPPGYVPVKVYVTAMFNDGLVVVPRYLNTQEECKSAKMLGSMFYKTYDLIPGLHGKPTSFDFQLLCCADFIKRISVDPQNLGKFIPSTFIRTLGAKLSQSNTLLEMYTYIHIDDHLKSDPNFIKDCDKVSISSFPKHPYGTVGSQFLKLLAYDIVE